MLILFIHLFFYYYAIYNIYIFFLLNMLYFATYSVNKYIKANNIMKSDNIFLKPFIYFNKETSNNLYYFDIALSKYKFYEQTKEKLQSISKQFNEFLNLTGSLMEQNGKELIMTVITPSPQDIMKMIPMLLAQKKAKVPVNPLLYDSDNDDSNIKDLSVD